MIGLLIQSKPEGREGGKAEGFNYVQQSLENTAISLETLLYQSKTL